MASDKRQQAAARALSALSAAPYQRCLTVIRFLGPLASRMDLGDLAPIVAGAAGPRLIGLRSDPVDVAQLARLLTLYPPGYGEGHVIETPYNETRLTVPILSAASHRLVYDLALEGRPWPGGIWSFPAPSLSEAVRLAAEHASSRILLRARPTPNAVVPPDPNNGSPITSPLLVSKPTRAESGPGFEWRYFSSQAAIDPDEDDVMIPAPLVAEYRKIVGEEHALQNETSDGTEAYHVPTGRDSLEWYGLDLPGNARLWLSVSDTDTQA